VTDFGKVGTLLAPPMPDGWANSPPDGVQAFSEGPDGEHDTDDFQQELLVMVTARLAACEIRRLGI
jgi:hypothetical protein